MANDTENQSVSTFVIFDSMRNEKCLPMSNKNQSMENQTNYNIRANKSIKFSKYPVFSDSPSLLLHCIGNIQLS